MLEDSQLVGVAIDDMSVYEARVVWLEDK